MKTILKSFAGVLSLVLLVSASEGLGNGRLLPLGPLREPLAQVCRADAVLLTGAGGDAGTQGEAEALAAWLRPRLKGPQVPLFTAAYRPALLRTLDGSATRPPESLAGQPVALLSAIAAPDRFAATLTGLGATLASQHVFPDHHPYGADTLAWLDRALAGTEHPAGGVDLPPPLWVTTEKDAIKLRGRLTQADRLWVMEMALQPSPEAEAFFFAFISEHAV